MKKKDGVSEKRIYIRSNTSIPMIIHFKQGETTKEVESITRNISATGMMVELIEQLPIGIEVKIDLNTPNSPNPVHCKGKIVWSAPTEVANKYNSGIAFTGVEEDNKSTFLKFLCDTIYKTSSDKE